MTFFFERLYIGALSSFGWGFLALSFRSGLALDGGVIFDSDFPFLDIEQNDAYMQ